ncbi:MAG: RNA-binding S4 domain-containing protein [Ectothiorhodospiraceae bacterium AqS1]|nr:RNA-binding S4 domain-containing protein [Ectothiorhodospiraceae bacterium AqS1]
MTRLSARTDASEASRSEKSDPEQADDASLDSLRIDKWLWAARFFKTRSSAAQAVSGGHIRIADQRIKPSRRLRRGESVRVRRGMQEWEIVVIGLCARRRQAPMARLLYRETKDSLERRTSEEARREQRDAAARSKRGDRHFRRDRRQRRAQSRGAGDGISAQPLSAIDPLLPGTPTDRPAAEEEGFEG